MQEVQWLCHSEETQLGFSQAHTMQSRIYNTHKIIPYFQFQIKLVNFSVSCVVFTFY